MSNRRVHVVNMIPKSMSGETNQDSEPQLTINPENHRMMVGTAFTPDPGGGPLVRCLPASMEAIPGRWI